MWYDDREGDYRQVIFQNAPATLEEVDEDLFERRTPEVFYHSTVTGSRRMWSLGHTDERGESVVTRGPV